MAKKRGVGRDYIGKRGEAITSGALLEFCGNPLPYFDPHFLGDKCPTYDFLVELVGAGKSPPYFLAQVKATKRGYTKGKAGLKVSVKAPDIQKIAVCPVPAYVIGIDEPGSKAFIVSVRGQPGGISSIPTRHPLDCVNLKKLWDEVNHHWSTLKGVTTANTSVFTF